jgi:tRNA(Ile)-lysidine synthase
LTGPIELSHHHNVPLEERIPWLKQDVRKLRHLVGVSGGADSVALLHLLSRAGFSDLVVCHLDHRLRGRASTEDARFVARLAKGLGLHCEVGRIDAKLRMEETGESMETAARHVRHGFFAECAAKHNCPRILLAHHADDQAETVLWNLLRGSHGMKGMREEQAIMVGNLELRLIRPLLGMRHQDLVDWLKSHKLSWREDASNSEPVAVRNRLRNEVFPLLSEVSGRDAVAAFARAADDAQLHEDADNEALDRANLLDPQGRLHLTALRKLPDTLQKSAIRRYLTDCGVPSIDRRLIESAMALLDLANPAVVNLPGGRRLRRKENRLWIAN